MKRFTSFILPAALMLSIPASALAADFTTGGLTYSTIDDTTVTVKKYVEGEDVVIPSTVKDDEGKEYTVVNITRQSFYKANVKTIKVAGTVKTIDPYAFWGATMTDIELAEGVEDLGYGAFRECASLTTITIPASLKELGSVFSLTGLDGAVFYGCSSLSKVEIPASIKRLPQMTFTECYALAEVTLNEGLESIGERVFESCSSLRNITIPASVTEIERGAFNKSGLSNPVFPGTVKIIPNSCYLWCQNMIAFTIEEGVVEIGKQSFSDCRGFTEINIPNSVEWIRSDAFQGNEHVKTIRIGNGVRRMGHSSLAVWAPNDKNQPQWALTDIYIESPVPPVHEQNDEHFDLVKDDFFLGDSKAFTPEYTNLFYSTVKLHVPEDAAEAYRQAPVWCNFKDINGQPGSGYNGVDAITAGGSFSIENGIATSEAPIAVFNMAGVRVAESAAGSLDLRTLGKGVYMVTSAGKTLKSVVR